MLAIQVETEDHRPRMSLRILFLGDVIGEPGRRGISSQLSDIRQELELDFVIANGENSAGGRGITPKITIELLRAGVAVITSGDHIWDQGEIVSHFELEPRLLRPLNYPLGTPGAGSIVLETKKGKVGVLNAQGRTFMKQELENPFLAVAAEVEKLREETPILVLDFHAEATSEKVAMGRFLDGQVSLVVGTHTHVQTADETIFPGGTAYLTDAGMCGPVNSIIGSGINPIIQKFRTSMPARFQMATGDVELRGVWVDVDEAGKALRIERFCRVVEAD
ncbi:MAG: TIGR00282 family metallophosphoesterase [Verrucomicrobiota bacterium]